MIIHVTHLAGTSEHFPAEFLGLPVVLPDSRAVPDWNEWFGKKLACVAHFRLCLWSAIKFGLYLEEQQMPAEASPLQAVSVFAAFLDAVDRAETPEDHRVVNGYVAWLSMTAAAVRQKTHELMSELSRIAPLPQTLLAQHAFIESGLDAAADAVRDSYEGSLERYLAGLKYRIEAN